MKSPMELNSFFSKFFCYITWSVMSLDWTRQWRTCKRSLYVKFQTDWYVVLVGPVCTVFLFWDWQKETSSFCYLDLMEWKETVVWLSSPPSLPPLSEIFAIINKQCFSGAAMWQSWPDLQVTTFYLDFWQEWILEGCWISLRILGYPSLWILAIF